MRFRILNSKKGIAIGDAVAMIIFLLVAAFGVFFFHINEDVKGKALVTDIQLQKDKLSGHEVLVGYMEDSDKSDLLAQAVIGKNYDALKNDMGQYFSGKLAGIQWHIDVKDSSNNLLFQIKSIVSNPVDFEVIQVEGAPYFIDSIVIPVSGADYISIDLKFIR